MPGESGLGRRVLTIVFVVAAFGAAVLIYFKYGKPSLNPPGSSDVDQVWLQCQKCGAEFDVTSAQYNDLREAGTADGVKCIKCGEPRAQLASMRCPHCKRLIVPPRESEEGAYVCPHCKKPLAPGASDRPPNVAPSTAPIADTDKP